ncbi:MAG: FlxA-like family protein, partial [Reyranella sp.]
MQLKSSARRVVLSVGAAAAALAMAAPAFAQSQPPSTQELLEQIRMLQKRIEQLEASERQRQQGADAKVRAARPQAAQPQAAPSHTAKIDAAPAAASGSTPDASPVGAMAPAGSGAAAAAAPAREPTKPDGSFMLGAVKLTLGGFIDLTGYYRSRNENRGTGTGYSTIPFYGPTPQGNSGEFGLSAQQTRLSVKLEAPIGPDSRVIGYGEIDFNNGSGGANSVQSNSYTPRLRQAFGAYEDESWQAYVLAGQAWTLATPFKKGLGALDTWQPPTIDHNYMVGYDYLRVPMVRAVKGFGNFWIGVEANTPQTVFGGAATVPAGQTVFTGYPGATGLNPQVNYSVDVAPDLIAKVALDTRFGHFDAFGVARWFRDQVAFGTTSVNYDAFGGGFGASAFVPIGPWIDLTGSIMYGTGIGRYGAPGLPDVTFNSNGGLVTLPQGMGMAGGVAHIIPTVLDFYGFYGWNWVGASAFVPIGPWIDLTGSNMYGTGIGRYGAPGLPDVTFNSNGGLVTLPQGMGTAGGVAHVIPSVLDFYGFYGWNWVGASYFPGGGYGNPDVAF